MRFEPIRDARQLTEPATGKTLYVFSCFNQDLPLEQVDFETLDERLRQNSTLEKQTRLWIDRWLLGLGARARTDVRRSEADV